VELRTRQVRRIADFPHAGDLVVNSTLYSDGTVAAMEELIGNHGGLGGEQTDAFLLHPGDMAVPETANSADLFGILDARRSLLEAKGEAAVAVDDDVVSDWAPSTLWHGLRQGRVWLPRTLLALVLDRSAYRDVARDPYMTGPALLIAFLAGLLEALVTSQSLTEAALVLAFRLVIWFLGVIAVFGAARLLGGTGSFTATLRGVGFAQILYVLDLLAMFPAISSLVRLITSLLVFVATWMAGLEAHDLHGWRGLLLPVARLVVAVVSIVVLGYLVAGAGFIVESLLREIGFLAPGP
jgi:hypothetical protein